MLPPLVVVDANYICYRAFYSTGSLSAGGRATGVVFGFMREVRALEDRYPNARLAFAFDYGQGKREQEYPWYKATRRAKRKKEMKSDPAKKKMWKAFQEQVDKLREDYLTRAGYSNVFFHSGYEADDVIARVVADRLQRNVQATNNTPVVIVSGDEDLYQLLNAKEVSVHHPKDRTTLTRKTFEKRYGIRVSDWVKVKAIAGCKSDDVPGVRGVAEKTALAYLTDPFDMPPAKRKAIDEFVKSEEYVRNLELVTLPYPGCRHFAVGKDKSNPNGWNEVMAELGANSLMLPTTPWGGSEVVF